MPFIAGNQPQPYQDRQMGPTQPTPQAQPPAMGQNQPTPVQQAPRQMPQQAWGMQQQFPRQNQGMQPYGRPQMPPWAQGRFGGQMGPRGPMDIGGMGKMGPGRMQGVSNPWGEQVHSTIPQQPIQQEELGTPMQPAVMPRDYGQPGPGMGSDGRFGMAQDRLMRQAQQQWRSGPMDLGPQFYY